MNKIAKILVLLVVATLVLVGCGGGEEAATPEVFKVAVVMPSAINDLAFSQSMYDALQTIQDERGADKFEFVYSESMFVVDDAAAAIRDYASQGYNLIIAPWLPVRKLSTGNCTGLPGNRIRLGYNGGHIRPAEHVCL